MSKAKQPVDDDSTPETVILAKWVCPCGTVTVHRERFRDDVPHHFDCGDMVYVEDVEMEIE